MNSKPGDLHPYGSEPLARQHDRCVQQGLMTLQRMRTGGQQVVTVQHVEVRDGGQAIVAGEVQAGAGGYPEASRWRGNMTDAPPAPR